MLITCYFDSSMVVSQHAQAETETFGNYDIDNHDRSLIGSY